MFIYFDTLSGSYKSFWNVGIQQATRISKVVAQHLNMVVYDLMLCIIYVYQPF